MNPEPGTNAAPIGTCGHVSGNLELSADSPDTSLVDAEDGKVFRLDGVDIRVVGDGKSATFRIVLAL